MKFSRLFVAALIVASTAVAVDAPKSVSQLVDECAAAQVQFNTALTAFAEALKPGAEDAQAAALTTLKEKKGALAAAQTALEAGFVSEGAWSKYCTRPAHTAFKAVSGNKFRSLLGAAAVATVVFAAQKRADLGQWLVDSAAKADSDEDVEEGVAVIAAA